MVSLAGTGGTTYFSHTDWLGTERVRSDVSGNSAGTCTSNPYGDNYACSGTDPSPIKYAGMEYDSETQLYHTLFRYYNPRLGLWRTPDPAGLGASDMGDPQSLNRYAYAGNDPVNLVDPSGLLAIFVCLQWSSVTIRFFNVENNGPSRCEDWMWIEFPDDGGGGDRGSDHFGGGGGGGGGAIFGLRFRQTRGTLPGSVLRTIRLQQRQP